MGELKKLKSLIKTKSFWAGVTAIIGGAGGYFTGTLDPVQAIQAIFAGFVVICWRDAARKGGQ